MSKVNTKPEWIGEELQTVDLKDKRLDQRMGVVLDELSRRPQASPRAACSGYAEWMATQRFFDNEKVGPAQVMAPHHDATLQRMAQYRRVLCLQDTSELDFSGRQEIEGAGYLDSPHSQGFYLHPLVVVTEERLCLGSLWAKFYHRPELGIRQTRKQRPIQDKESVRWLEGYRQACAAAQQLPETQVISVQDAEGDIYEALLEVQKAGPDQPRRAEHITRAAQDRRTDSTEGLLWAELLASPLLGRVSFDLPKRGERAARKVTLEIHAKKVTLRAPARPKGQRMPDLKVGAVLAREVDAPPGAGPVEWLLLTSLPVNTFEEAVQVMKWYTCRWEIEIFFKVFKSGCQVERLQLKEAERLLPAFALYMIIAWRILYLTMLGRATPEMSCAAVLEEAEWKAVWVVTQKKAPPAQPPHLAQMIKLIAELGGHKGRKSEGPPGPKTMWEGLRRVFDLALAWNTFGPEINHTYARHV
jgi:hypothetical protein